MTAVEVLAPAKVNLALHVVGRRPDGYHLIDSLVAFADLGDRLDIAPAAVATLAVAGPEAGGVPAGPENLALRAAGGHPCAIRLYKEIPAAAGLGGGSADAAAVLRALQRPDADAAAAALGADVPMCLASATARAEGIGDVLTPVPLPDLPALLVNPRRGVPTAEVFRALACEGARTATPMGPVPRATCPADLARWLGTTRNDLTAPAVRLCPEIAAVLDALAALPGALLARMSGSGATCFALFAAPAGAEAAARTLRRARPDWWIAPTMLGDRTIAARPRPARTDLNQTTDQAADQAARATT